MAPQLCQSFRLHALLRAKKRKGFRFVKIDDRLPFPQFQNETPLTWIAYEIGERVACHQFNVSDSTAIGSKAEFLATAVLVSSLEGSSWFGDPGIRGQALLNGLLPGQG